MEFLEKTRRHWIDYFISKMNRAEYGSEEYEKSRKIFSWLCVQVRKELRNAKEELLSN